MRKMNCKLFLLLPLLFSFAHAGYAQAGLKGTVKNELMEPIAGATLSLLNTNRFALSDSAGSFHFNNLLPGIYTVQVTSTGYASFYKSIQTGAAGQEMEIILLRHIKVLEEVLITAQKSEEMLQRSPFAVTALTSRQVEQYQVWNINDLTAIASNLFAADPGDNRNVTSIRGIVNTSYDQAVATYIDGVNQFGLDTYIPHLFDVERIEVLKGPQGTLYGRNAMGGVINIITKKPGNHTDGFAQLSAGNHGLQRYSAGFRVPLIKNKLFLGASGLYEQMNGFYTNKFNNTKYDQRNSLTGNYYLRFVPGQRWSIVLNAKHNSNRNRGPFPLVVGVEEAFDQPYLLNQNAVTKMIDEVLNASLSLNYAGSGFVVSSQTAYQSNHRYYTDPIDADFSPVDAISIYNNYGDDWNKVKALTQEINVRSSVAKKGFTWLAGTYFFTQKNPVKQAILFGEQAQLLGAPENHFSLISSSRGESKGAAVYGQLTYTLKEKLAFTAGLRYDGEKKEQQILGEYQKDPDPEPAFDYRSDTTAAADFSAWSPKAVISFYPNDNATIYGSFSRGFRAGGLTPLSSDPSQPALYSFLPEISHNIEAGWKQTAFNRKLVFNLAVFHTTVSDVQVPTLVLPDAVTITRNTGQLVSKGMEADLKLLPFEGLQLEYGFGYTKATYTELKVSQGGSEMNLNGKRQLFTPDVTSMLALQYSRSLGTKKIAQLTARGEWKFLGTQYFDLANAIRQPSYHMFNGRLGLSIHKVEVNAWGRNLSNTRYISYAYDFGAVHLGDPVTYGVSMSLKL